MTSQSILLITSGVSLFACVTVSFFTYFDGTTTYTTRVATWSLLLFGIALLLIAACIHA